MHVDLDAFFVEVCRQHHPELRGVELLVVGGRRDQRGVVQSASYAARAYGVRSGMPIAEAVRRCPAAVFFQGDFAHYRGASRAVRAVLAEFSPIVAMASLDEGYLDFTGTERLHPCSLLPEAERVRAAIRARTGLAASIGIGTNRMIAKMASDFSKPQGLMEVRAGWETGFLAGLPLRALPGVGPRTAQRWQELGLVEVRQVQQMDERALRQLIGNAAPALKWRADGHGGTALRAGRLPRSMSRESTLARDERDPARLEKHLALLAARVAAQLRHEGLVARTVTIKVRQENFDTATRRCTLVEPTNLDRELQRPAIELFRRLFRDARHHDRGVRLIGISAGGIAEAVEDDLFESDQRRRMRRLTDAVDVVRNRFGFDAMQEGQFIAPDLKRRRRD